MVNQSKSETKTKKSKHKTLCIKAGKLAGSLVRQVYPLGTSAYEVAQQAVKKGEQVVDTICFCKRVGRKKGIKSYEKKQQQFFTQLGNEIFFLKIKGVKNIFDQPRVKELMAEAQKIEDEIQVIKNKIETERLARKAELKFNRALADLKNNNPEIRLMAIRILEESGKKEAISCLSSLLENPDESVRIRAVEVIKKLTDSVPATAEKTEVEPEPEPEVKPELETKPEPKPKSKPRPQPKAKSKSRPRPKPKPKAKPETKPVPGPGPESEIKPEPKPESKSEAEVKPEPKTESETEYKPEPEVEIKPQIETESKEGAESEPETKSEPRPETGTESESKSEAEPESESETESSEN